MDLKKSFLLHFMFHPYYKYYWNSFGINPDTFEDTHNFEKIHKEFKDIFQDNNTIKQIIENSIKFEEEMGGLDRYFNVGSKETYKSITEHGHTRTVIINTQPYAPSSKFYDINLIEQKGTKLSFDSPQYGSTSDITENNKKFQDTVKKQVLARQDIKNKFKNNICLYWNENLLNLLYVVDANVYIYSNNKIQTGTSTDFVNYYNCRNLGSQCSLSIPDSKLSETNNEPTDMFAGEQATNFFSIYFFIKNQMGKNFNKFIEQKRQNQANSIIASSSLKNEQHYYNIYYLTALYYRDKIQDSNRHFNFLFKTDDLKINAINYINHKKISMVFFLSSTSKSTLNQISKTNMKLPENFMEDIISDLDFLNNINLTSKIDNTYVFKRSFKNIQISGISEYYTSFIDKYYKLLYKVTFFRFVKRLFKQINETTNFEQIDRKLILFLYKRCEFYEYYDYRPSIIHIMILYIVHHILKGYQIFTETDKNDNIFYNIIHKKFFNNIYLDDIDEINKLKEFLRECPFTDFDKIVRGFEKLDLGLEQIYYEPSKISPDLDRVYWYPEKIIEKEEWEDVKRMRETNDDLRRQGKPSKYTKKDIDARIKINKRDYVSSNTKSEGKYDFNKIYNYNRVLDNFVITNLFAMKNMKEFKYENTEDIHLLFYYYCLILWTSNKIDGEQKKKEYDLYYLENKHSYYILYDLSKYKQIDKINNYEKNWLGEYSMDCFIHNYFSVSAKPNNSILWPNNIVIPYDNDIYNIYQKYIPDITIINYLHRNDFIIWIISYHLIYNKKYDIQLLSDTLDNIQDPEYEHICFILKFYIKKKFNYKKLKKYYFMNNLNENITKNLFNYFFEKILYENTDFKNFIFDAGDFNNTKSEYINQISESFIKEYQEDLVNLFPKIDLNALRTDFSEEHKQKYPEFQNNFLYYYESDDHKIIFLKFPTVVVGSRGGGYIKSTSDYPHEISSILKEIQTNKTNKIKVDIRNLALKYEGISYIEDNIYHLCGERDTDWRTGKKDYDKNKIVKYNLKPKFITLSGNLFIEGKTPEVKQHYPISPTKYYYKSYRILEEKEYKNLPILILRWVRFVNNVYLLEEKKDIYSILLIELNQHYLFNIKSKGLRIEPIKHHTEIKENYIQKGLEKYLDHASGNFEICELIINLCLTQQITKDTFNNPLRHYFHKKMNKEYDTDIINLYYPKFAGGKIEYNLEEYKYNIKFKTDGKTPEYKTIFENKEAKTIEDLYKIYTKCHKTNLEFILDRRTHQFYFELEGFDYDFFKSTLKIPKSDDFKDTENLYDRVKERPTINDYQNFLETPGTYDYSETEFKKIKNNNKYFKTKIELEKEIEVVLNLYKIYTFFELMFGHRVRPEQLKIVKNIILDMEETDKKKKVFHFLMGKGKSSVITPLLTLYYISQGVKQIILLMPNHLLRQSNETLMKYSYFFNDYHYEICKIDRENKKITPYEDRKQILLMDNTSIQCALLNALIDNKLKPLNDTILIMDEFDSLLNPLQSELNYPVSKDMKKLDDHDINLLLTEILFDKEYESAIEEQKIDLTKFLKSKLLELAELQIENQKLIDVLKFINEQIEPPDPVKLDPAKPEITFIAYYYILQKLIFLIPSLSKLLYNKNYGLGNFIPKIPKNNKIAIPYSAVNKPADGSEFSDPYITLILTTLTYKNRYLKNEELVKLLNKEIQKLYDLFIKIDKIPDFLNDIFKNNSIAFKKIKERKIIKVEDIQSNEINKNPFLIKLYLTEYIFKYIEYSPNNYNVSFIDIINSYFCEKRTGFSGTVQIDLPKVYCEMDCSTEKEKLIEEKDNLKCNRTEIEYLHKIKNEFGIIEIDEHGETKIKTSITSSTQTHQIQDKHNILAEIIKLLKSYNVLIDTGAFLRQYNNKEISRIFHKNLSKNILYLDDKSDKYIFDGTQDIPFSEYSGKDYFLYYDQKHTVGIDVPDQDPELIGLVTISTFNRYTGIAQGIFRLRKIGENQKVNFLLNQDVKIQNNIFEHLVEKEQKYLENSKIKHYIQSLRTNIRIINKHKIDDYTNTFFDLTIFPKKYYNKNKETIIKFLQNSEKQIYWKFIEKTYIPGNNNFLKHLHRYLCHYINKYYKGGGKDTNKQVEQEQEQEQGQEDVQEKETQESLPYKNIMHLGYELTTKKNYSDIDSKDIGDNIVDYRLLKDKFKIYVTEKWINNSEFANSFIYFKNDKILIMANQERFLLDDIFNNTNSRAIYQGSLNKLQDILVKLLTYQVNSSEEVLCILNVLKNKSDLPIEFILDKLYNKNYPYYQIIIDYKSTNILDQFLAYYNLDKLPKNIRKQFTEKLKQYIELSKNIGDNICKFNKTLETDKLFESKVKEYDYLVTLDKSKLSELNHTSTSIKVNINNLEYTIFESKENLETISKQVNQIFKNPKIF